MRRRRSSAVVVCGLAVIAIGFVSPRGTGARAARPAGSRLGAQPQRGVAEGMLDMALARTGPFVQTAGAATLAAAADAAEISAAPGVAGWREAGPIHTDPDPAARADGRGTLRRITGDPTLPADVPIRYGFGRVTGRVTALAVDPSDETGDTLWAGTAGGGLWVTRDGGASWETSWDAMPSLAIGAVAVDGSGRIFVGTGESNFAGGAMFPGTGVYRSLDGGATWQRPAQNVGGATVVARIDVAGDLVFVATNMGLFRSADAAASFQDVRLPTNFAGTAPASKTFGNVVTDVRVKPGNPSVVTAAVGWMFGRLGSDGNGLYRSTQSGAPGTWTRMEAPGFGAASDSSDPIGRISLSYASGEGQDHDVLWAIVQDAGYINGENLRNAFSSYLNGVYRSGDDGATWEVKATAETFAHAPGTGLSGGAVFGYAPGVQSWYNQWIAVSPSDADTVFVGLEEIYQTVGEAGAPGPAAWRTIGRYWNICFFLVPCNPAGAGLYAGETTHPDQHAVAFALDGSRLYVGNDGGVYRQDAEGQLFTNDGWISLNTPTFRAMQPYAAQIASDGAVLAGTQDNGTILVASDSTSEMIFGGDGGDVAVERDPARMWGETPYASTFVTRDGGYTFVSNAPAVSAPLFITPLEMDALDDRHVVIGGNDIYATTQGTDTRCDDERCDWWWVYSLGSSPQYYTNQASALDVRGPIVYAGFCGPCAPPKRATKYDESLFWSGIATNYRPGCAARPADNACWHRAAAAGLPKRYISDVAIDPDDPATIYVTLTGYSSRWLPPSAGAPDVGSGHVYRSTDGGETFTDISRNLPDVPAGSIEAAGGRLFVGTDLGAFTKAAQGGTWKRLGTGLPNSPILDLNLSRDGNTIVVATHGRGAWTLDVSSFGIGPVGQEAAVPVAAAERPWRPDPAPVLLGFALVGVALLPRRREARPAFA